MELTKKEKKLLSKIQSIRGKASAKVGMSMSERGKKGVDARIRKYNQKRRNLTDSPESLKVNSDKKTPYKRVKEWRERNPEKNKAQKIVFINLRNGNIVRESCKICGNPKSEVHHEDYSKPLEIVWLCKKHHSEADIIRRELDKSTIHKQSF